MKKFLFFLLFFNFAFCAIFAQNGIVTGKVVDNSTKEEVPDVIIKVSEATNVETISQFDGTFRLELPAGKDYTLIFSKEGYDNFFIKTNAVENEITNIGTVSLELLLDNFQDIPTILFLDSEDDSDFASQNIISLMAGGQDVYQSKSAHNFGAVRFNVRGLDSEYNITYINGVNFNDQIRGRFNYSMLGGLNDATRNKDIDINTTPSSYGFGDVGGITNIDTRAASYGQGGRITASATNRNYKLRGIGTYSTGLMENGIAVTTSVGYRWADEGYFEGTFYNSFSYLLAVEKVFGERKHHSLSLTTIGSPTQRGQHAASYQEIYDLLGTRYNPNWGYQNGVKRNQRVVTAYDPMAVLSHKWIISPNSQLQTGFGVRYNQYGITALNWYNSADPRPDYYKYLPSYYIHYKFDDEEDKFIPTNLREELVEKSQQDWRNDQTVSQIDWDKLYRENYSSKNLGESARYILEERHSNLLEFAFNTTFQSNLSDWQILEIGIEAKKSKGMYFKTINDLLGAEYWRDIDHFAERDFAGDKDIIQNDLKNPNREVKVGDKFGYNYDINVHHANFWIQNRYFFPKIELYYAAKFSYTEFHREGHYENGKYTGNQSFGKGKSHHFFNQAIKGGFTFKITGQHFIDGNILYETRAPLPWNAYLSSRIKDEAVPELSSERVASADISYLIALPVVKGRITVFQTNFFDQNEIYNFYYDSEYFRTFVNYVMTGINKYHRGVEMGFEFSITSRLKLETLGTIAEYCYSSRPIGHATYENGSNPPITETIYLENFFVGGTPQIAASAGLNYAFPNYWYLNVNYNYFDRIYVDLMPIRRTVEANPADAKDRDKQKERNKERTEQEKFDPVGTLDASIGKSHRFKNGYFLNLNFSVDNILDQSLRTGGFEQGRFDFDRSILEKFPSKYYYGYGRTFFINVAFRF
ncbi:MAG: TonB-dependent receptor [Marinilabiliaceae bacterium]|nr:TonB-dependent receptor [Marinilabiliaceae bacterium]